MACTASVEGGSLQTIGDNLVVRNAAKVRFYITAETTFTEYLGDFEAHDWDCDFSGERLAELAASEVLWKKNLDDI